MHNIYKQKLDAMEGYRKLLIGLSFLFLFVFFVYLLIFDSKDIKSTTILNGRLVAGSSGMAKTPFQNCVVELDNKQVVVARCEGLSQLNGQVKVVQTIYSNNEAVYSVCTQCINLHSSGTPNGAS